MATLHVNELLCFVSTQFDKLDRNNLNSVILEFYARNELIDAKNTLVSICDKIGISNLIAEFRTKRIASNVEQKVAKDILDIWSIIDSEKGGNIGVVFVAQDPNRLPSVNAEKAKCSEPTNEPKEQPTDRLIDDTAREKRLRAFGPAVASGI